jgi:hypothetical protein
MEFIQGKVLKVTVTLEAKPFYIYEPGALCLFADDSNKIGLNGDRDCDGVPDELDCGPQDPFDVGMGSEEADEVCDGVDNDCDAKCDEGFDDDEDGFFSCGSIVDDEGEQCIGSREPDCDDMNDQAFPGAAESCTFDDLNCDGTVAQGVPCFTLDNSQCLLGEVACSSANPLDDCIPTFFGDGAAIPPLLCEDYADCIDTLADPQRCFNQVAQPYHCNLRFEDMTPDSLCVPNFLELPAVAATNNCGWKLVTGLNQSVPYVHGLVTTKGDAPAPSIATCTGFLVVDMAYAVSQADVFVVFTPSPNPGELHRITLFPTTGINCNDPTEVTTCIPVAAPDML